MDTERSATFVRVNSGKIKTGIGFGCALAITISWSLHRSVIWAIIHGFLSWLYVLYYVVTR